MILYSILIIYISVWISIAVNIAILRHRHRLLKGLNKTARVRASSKNYDNYLLLCLKYSPVWPLIPFIKHEKKIR